MVTVTLAADGRAVDRQPGPSLALPRRLRLSKAAVEHLAARTGSPLPWEHDRRPAAPSALGDRPAQAGVHGPDTEGPAAELIRQHLMTRAGRLDPEVVDALAVLGSPEVLVDVDVSVRRTDAPDGFGQLHSWQRRRGGRVASLSTAGGRLLELGWHDDALWQVELARAVTVRAPATAVPLPAAVVDLPHELLLGSGAALRLHREEVLADLVRRHTGRVHVDDDPVPLGAAGTDEQVRRLHAAARGRMRTVVAGIGTGGARRVGWVSWLLFPDGWRALVPHVRDGQPRVRLQPVAPLRLGVEVARLVTEVRS